ncbi:MAG: hypothetical protein ACT4NL_00730 [Pseudomarimonas sp.]
MTSRPRAPYLLFLVLGGVASSPAQAGAWTQPQGNTYQKLAYNYFSSERTFGAPGVGFERFTDNNVTYYGEVGLRPNLTLFGSLPFKQLSSNVDGESFDSNDLGDVDLGLRYNLVNADYQLSTSLLVKLPYLYNEDAEVPLGNGQEDVEGRLLYGKSLGSYGYVGFELGYRLRVGAPADEIRYLVEYGIDASESLYLRAKLDAIEGVGNASESASALPGGNPLLSLEFDLGKLETTLGWRLTPRVAAEFTATSNLYGNNTLKGVNYMFAVVYSD